MPCTRRSGVVSIEVVSQPPDLGDGRRYRGHFAGVASDNVRCMNTCQSARTANPESITKAEWFARVVTSISRGTAAYRGNYCTSSFTQQSALVREQP